MNHLTPDDIAQFDEEGYLVFEGLFNHDLNERIKADVDQLMIDRETDKRRMLMAYPELGLRNRL